MPTISTMPEAFAPVGDVLQRELDGVAQFRGLDVALNGAIDGMASAVTQAFDVQQRTFEELDRLDVEFRMQAPEDGWKQERQTALTVAEVSRDQVLADIAGNRNLGELLAGNRARPKVDTDDLALRDELKTLIGNAGPEQLSERTRDVAVSGRRDLGALLTSAYGKTLLTGIGVLDADPELHERLWGVMAATAEQYGKSEKERQYGGAYQAFRVSGQKVHAAAAGWLRSALETVQWSGTRRAAADAAYQATQFARVSAARRGGS